MPQDPQRQPLRRYIRFAVLVLCILAIAGVTAGVAFAGASTGAVQHATSASAPGAPAVTATPTPCVPAWTIVPSPDQAPSVNYLSGVSAISDSDIWAVGHSIDSTIMGLTEHWDGATWTIVPDANQQNDTQLLAVAAVSSNDVWAVGWEITTGFGQLFEHWNGTSWAVVPAPPLQTSQAILQGAAAASASDVWAVGYYSNDTDQRAETLIDHWGGTAWSVVPSPNVGTTDNYLEAVTAVSGNDVWAVGYQNNQTLIEHWDGTAWAVVASPGQPSAANYLYGIDAASANDIWAVGNYGDNTGGHTLTEHWDGATWTVVPSPDQVGGTNNLYGAAAISANDAWAVGTGPDGTLAEHWDGAAWSLVPSPNPPAGGGNFWGVDKVSANSVWAVGGIQDTLVEHYTGCDQAGTPTATPTSTPIRTATLTPSPSRTSSPGSASPTTTIPAVTATPTSCTTGWSVVPWDGGTQGQQLFAVKAWSSNNVWTVGTDNTLSLVIHWDGAQWTVVPSPSVSGRVNTLSAIDGTGPGNMWAVGDAFDSFTGGADPLAMRWDGTQWTMATLPAVSGYYTTLAGVAAVAANDVWAVGWTGGSTSWQTLIMHWDGTQWSIVPSPNPNQSARSALHGIAAYSSNDIWAVGAGNMESYSTTLVEHWDGSQWSIVPSPSVPSEANALAAVTVASQNSVWAVGNVSEVGPPDAPSSSLVQHWDGSAWTTVTSPNPSQWTFLSDTSAASANDVWAVGEYETGQLTGIYDTAIMRWDGSSWQLVTSPNPSTDFNQLRGVSAISSAEAWATGEQDVQSVGHTLLAEQYRDCAAPSPSPTALALTATPTATATIAVTTSPTSHATPPDTATSAPTGVAATATATPVATACALTFSDVPPGSTFYPYIHCLACLGIINGYPDGSFKPNNNVTRGQLSKIVSNSAGFSDPQPTQMFQDVPLGSTFQVYIGRLASRGYINGYPCGGPNELCVPPGNLPYFRPGNNATRGQISKIDANAAGFSDPPTGQQFEDVPVGSAFYTYTYRLVSRSVMSGYPCGGVGEPCVPPGNLPYFRPNNNATRGQTSKIVGNTFFPGCNPPAGMMKICAPVR